MSWFTSAINSVADGINDVANSAGQIAGDTANATWSAGAQLTSGAVGIFNNMSEAEVRNNTNKSLMVMWWGYQDTAYTGYDGFDILGPGRTLKTHHAKPDPQGVQVGVVHTIEHMDIVDYINCIISCSSQTLNLGQAKLYFQITCCKYGSPIAIESVRGDANNPSKGKVTFSGHTWWGGLYSPQYSCYQSSSLTNWFAGKTIDLGQLGLDMVSLGATAGAKAVAKELAKKLAKQCVNEFKGNLKAKVKSVAKEQGLKMVENMLNQNLSALHLPPRTIKGIAQLLIGDSREIIVAS